MAAVFEVSFDRVYNKEKRMPVCSSNVHDAVTVAARDAEEAIRKVRKSEIGKTHEEEDLPYRIFRVRDLVINSVRFKSTIDVA